jgi:hypothetical protein
MFSFFNQTFFDMEDMGERKINKNTILLYFLNSKNFIFKIFGLIKRWNHSRADRRLSEFHFLNWRYLATILEILDVVVAVAVETVDSVTGSSDWWHRDRISETWRNKNKNKT